MEGGRDMERREAGREGSRDRVPKVAQEAKCHVNCLITVRSRPF